MTAREAAERARELKAQLKEVAEAMAQLRQMMEGGELRRVDFKMRERAKELLRQMVEAGNRQERERLSEELSRLMF